MDWSSCIRPELEPLNPYAPGLRGSEVRERAGVSHVCKLSSNENPYGPFPRALKAMRKVLVHTNLYPDGSSRVLKAALAERYGMDGSRIMLGNGSNELLCLIGQAVLRPGDEVVFAWPSFVVYPMVAQVAGAVPVAVPLADGFTHDLDAMLEAITERTRIVFVCNPNNPTGTFVDKRAFARFMDRVPDHVIVVVDEAYIEYVTDPEFPDALGWFDGERPLVVLRTFSKIYALAGVRCGYGFAPRPLVEAIEKVREPFNVNTVAQVGAYYSLEDTGELARRKDANARERERLYECFLRLGVPFVESQTNFVWVVVTDSTAVFEALLREGVIVRDFGAGGALRVGVGSPEDTDATIAAFDKLFG